jgi:hypothetical protein
MRPGGGFNKEKGIKALAWISFTLAAVGGAALASTFIGTWTAALLGVFPSWVGILIVAGGFVAMAIDLFVDGIPNQVALYTAIGLPVVARSVPGRLGDTVTDLSGRLLGSLQGALGDWLGTSSALGMAVVSVVVSLLMARRVIAKTR